MPSPGATDQTLTTLILLLGVSSMTALHLASARGRAGRSRQDRHQRRLLRLTVLGSALMLLSLCAPVPHALTSLY